MELWQQIESYLSRQVNFNSEVILRADTDSDYKPYIDEWNINTPQPTQDQLDAITTLFVDPVQTKIANDVQTMLNLFNTYSLGVQVAFEPAKSAVISYIQKNDYTSALEIIRTYPLMDALEPYRQGFETALENLMNGN